jgi:hypothetical protein
MEKTLYADREDSDDLIMIKGFITGHNSSDNFSRATIIVSDKSYIESIMTGYSVTQGLFLFYGDRLCLTCNNLYKMRSDDTLEITFSHVKSANNIHVERIIKIHQLINE